MSQAAPKFVVRSFTRLLRWRAIRACTGLVSLGIFLSGCETKEAPPDFLKGNAGSDAIQSNGAGSGSAEASSAPKNGAVTKGQLGTNASGASGAVASGTAASNIAVHMHEGALSGTLYRNGSELGNMFLPETTGGGIAVLDFDRDGRPDLLSAGGGTPEVTSKTMLGLPGALLRNASGFVFRSVSDQARLDLSATYNCAIVVADYDADGFPDVLSTGYSGLQLFHNCGDGTLELVTTPAMESAGAGIGLKDSQWSSAAAFLDANNDGLLDLYVAHYANWSFENNPICKVPAGPGSSDSVIDYCGPREFKGLTDAMFENRGDGTFANISEVVGIDETLRGLGVMAADLDGDRDVDIYVSNDVDPNLLYRNDGDFHFTEVARRSGVACNDSGIPEGSMGIALGDYNLDGKLDLWVTNYQNEVNALYKNNGNLFFTYASNTARIGPTDEASVGWGTAFVDMELDGDEDLVVANGHIETRAIGSAFDQRPQILDNIEGKFFRLVPRVGNYLALPQPSRAVAMADFNGDGLLDYAVSRLNMDAALVENRSKRLGKYIVVRLIGTSSNRDAIGTSVRLSAGGKSWVRQRFGGGSYAATGESLLHFGVPASVASDSPTLTVDWPSGKSQTITLDGWDRDVLVVEEP